jgi:flagellin-like protein
MKGVSAVIATLLMLVITVALAITAYGFITGQIRTTIERNIDVVDKTCVLQGTTGTYNITVRNTDPINTVLTSSIVTRVNEVSYSPACWKASATDCIAPSFTSASAVPANSGTAIATIRCGGAGQPACVSGTAYALKVIGPAGRALVDTVTCG